jgi:P4 family phage/plasmid primase-like protien
MIADFIQHWKLKSMIVQTSIGKTGKKDYWGIISKKDINKPEAKTWESPQFTFADCEEWNNGEAKKSKYSRTKFNQAIIMLDNPTFIVFDTDDERSYTELTHVLKDLDIATKVTDSFGKRMENKQYKNHFWFRVEKDEVDDFKDFRGWTQGTGWDLFHGSCKIAEWLDTPMDFTEMFILSIDQFKAIYNHLAQECPLIHVKKDINEPTKKPEKVRESIQEFKNIIDNSKESDEHLETILDNLKPHRFESYKWWWTMACIFVNEGFKLSTFDRHCKKYEKYDQENNRNIISSLQKNSNGYSVATLYKWLKEDNPQVFKELQKSRHDIWRYIADSNQANWAKCFFNLVPDRYIVGDEGDKVKWYEYNDKNILRKHGKLPNGLICCISDTLMELVNDQIAHIRDDDKNKQAKLNLIKTAYKSLGMSAFIKGIAEYLEKYFYISKLEEKLNHDRNLLAFDNLVFDLSLERFREIRKDDFITVTTNYDVNTKSNASVRKQLMELIYTLFEDDEMVQYWLNITGYSLFTTKLEKMYIHCGNTRNGKGLMATLIDRALGSNLFKTAESTFLNTSLKANTPNPTLAGMLYARYVSISEPETNTENSTMNVDFVKKVTGNDKLTCRTLFKENNDFYARFVIHIMCNGKPELNKIDKAIMERLVVIEYPFQFVDNPKLPHERKINRNLKEMISKDDDLRNEFILLLIEHAVYCKNNELTTPESVIKNTNEYFEENNPVRTFLTSCYDVTGNMANKVRCSDFLERYNNDPTNERKMNRISIREAMKTNGFIPKLFQGISYFTGLIEKAREDDSDFLE